MSQFEQLKGTKTFAYNDASLKEEIISTLKKNFEKFGYNSFQSPTIEFFNNLTNKYDENAEIVSEIFKVKDRGNRTLALRYDLTIPMCIYLARNIKNIKFPFKRYEVGNVFRDGPIKIGRQREFTQCDCDVVGISNVGIEAELLNLYQTCFDELKIKYVIEINSNKILKGAFLQVGFLESNLDFLCLVVDKLKKLGVVGVLDEIKKKNLDIKKAKKSIEILTSKNFLELKKKATNEILIEGIFELENLEKLIKKLKINYRINFSMSRGLNYYTANIWEVYDTTKKVTSSIGSGGRYDKGISNFLKVEKEIPACGISFGITPILEILQKKNLQKKNELIVIAPLKEELISTSQLIAKKLRGQQKFCEISYDLKLKKAFEYANLKQAKELIIIGEKDFEKKQYTIKNLKTGTEKKQKI